MEGGNSTGNNFTVISNPPPSKYTWFKVCIYLRLGLLQRIPGISPYFWPLIFVCTTISLWCDITDVFSTNTNCAYRKEFEHMQPYSGSDTLTIPLVSLVWSVQDVIMSGWWPPIMNKKLLVVGKQLFDVCYENVYIGSLNFSWNDMQVNRPTNKCLMYHQLWSDIFSD